MSSSFQADWARYKKRANQQLIAQLAGHEQALQQAMRYSTQNGGKRFRAMLVYAGGDCFGAQPKALDAPAMALELIHAYSLVHDDLPAMDDDDLRRGHASCHIQFDEATAILTGDALQSLAFEILSQPNEALSPQQQLKMVHKLAQASGPEGMAGGQALDIAATGQTQTRPQLQNIHQRKTGALIRAALSLGALAANDVSDHELDTLDKYGRDIGLAFQVVDDILDQTQSSQQLGKTSGADAALDKQTYPAIMGLEGAQQYAAELIHSAHQSLGKLERDTQFLSQLADFTLSRDH